MLATVLRAVTPWCHSLLRSPFTNCGTWIDNPSATTHSAASSTLSPIDHIVQITSPTLTTIGKVSPWQVPTVATNESIRCQWETPSAPHAASLLPSPVDANRSQIPGGNVLALELPPVPSELPPKINQVTGWIEPVTPLPQVSRLVGRLHGETKDLQGDISEAGKLRMKAMSFWIVGFIYSLTPEGQGRGRPALSTYDETTHAELVERVYRILLWSIMSPSTLFTALYFVEQLPFLVRSDDDASRRELHRLLFGNGTIATEEIIFRAFIVGSLIADKAHHDYYLSATEWCYVSSYDAAFIQKMELLSLKTIGWNTVINARQWDAWMRAVSVYHATLGDQEVDSTQYDMWSIIDRVRDGDPHWDCSCTMGASLKSTITRCTPPPIYTAKSTEFWQECNEDPTAFFLERHMQNLICALNGLPTPLHTSHYPNDITPLPYFKGRRIQGLNEVGEKYKHGTTANFQIPQSLGIRDHSDVTQHQLEEPGSTLSPPQAFSYTTAENLALDLLAGKFSVLPSRRI